MTRDGTFLVENGKLASGIRNFRFNQSVLEMLSNVEAMSPSVRAAGEESFENVVVPANESEKLPFQRSYKVLAPQLGLESPSSPVNPHSGIGTFQEEIATCAQNISGAFSR